MLHPRNERATLRKTRLPFAIQTGALSAIRQGGAIAIGKLNLILIGLIVVILFALISKEESNSGYSNHSARLQPTIPAAEIPAETVEPPSSGATETIALAAEPVTPAKAPAKESSKKTKKVEVTPPVMESGPVVQVQTSQAPTAPSPPVAEPVVPKDPPTKMLVFNIWSVSELRLRSTYTAWMNDSGVSAAQLEARKKEYLNFVAQRARKCGELDSKFASNINTVEKLNFNKNDVETLECHATENNAEIDKMHARGA